MTLSDQWDAWRRPGAGAPAGPEPETPATTGAWAPRTTWAPSTRAPSAPPTRWGGGAYPEPPPARKRWLWLIVPIAVTVAVLGASALAAFVWTDSYVGSVVSGIEHERPPTTSAGSATTVPASAGAASASSVLAKTGPAVWALHTFDSGGQPVDGSAVGVLSTSQRTYLVTSFALVQAATVSPAPPIQVGHPGGASYSATLVNWDPAHDLALLQVGRAGLAVLHGSSASAQPGQPLYVVSGSGGADGSIATGKAVVDSGEVLAYQATQPTGAAGGAVVDTSGGLVGLDSPGYVPTSAPSVPSGSTFAVAVHDFCASVLSCPGGELPTG